MSSLAHGSRAPRSARYGNVNYAILGELVSRVSGLPYEEYVRTALLSPLGADLAFEDDGRESALGYVGRFSPMLLLLRFLAPETARRVRGDRVGALVSLATDCAHVERSSGTWKTTCWQR